MTDTTDVNNVEEKISESEFDFDLNAFNMAFDQYIDLTLAEYEIEDDKRLVALNKKANPDPGNNPSTTNIGNIGNHTKQAWQDIFDELSTQNVSSTTFFKDNRLFYIALTIFVIAFLIYVILMIVTWD